MSAHTQTLKRLVSYPCPECDGTGSYDSAARNNPMARTLKCDCEDGRIYKMAAQWEIDSDDDLRVEDGQ